MIVKKNTIPTKPNMINDHFNEIVGGMDFMDSMNTDPAWAGSVLLAMRTKHADDSRRYQGQILRFLSVSKSDAETTTRMPTTAMMSHGIPLP